MIPAALRALEAQGFETRLDEVETRRAGQIFPQIDGRVQIRRGKARLAFIAEAKRTATPGTLGAVVAQLRHLEDATGEPALLVAEYLPPPAAQRLVDLGRQFIDTAGNAYLDGPGLYVCVLGRRPTTMGAKDPEGKAFTAAGLKTVFALLCDPELAAAPLRQIATAADVAFGGLPPILADLERSGDLVQTKRTRRLVGTKKLLDIWAMGYARTLRPRTILGRYRAGIEDWEKWDLQHDGCLWGGEPAAQLLVGHIRPGMLTIYARKRPAWLIVQRKMRLTDQAGTEVTIEIRAPFWGPELMGPRKDVVPLPLVYADIPSGGRCPLHRDSGTALWKTSRSTAPTALNSSAPFLSWPSSRPALGAPESG